jgi:hypothetical protein
MVCKNEQAIQEKKKQLLLWLTDDPSSILKKAKKFNTATPVSEYLADLDTLLASKFKRGCRPETRTLERERVIVRYVVHVHLQMMDRGRKKRSPLVAHRNQETPVEKSIRSRRNDQVDRGPAATVTAELEKASSFFTPRDRTRIGYFGSRARPRTVTVPSAINDVNQPETLDFTQLRVATVEETRTLARHRLILRTEHCDVHLHHHPMEVYMAWGLHDVSHIYENKGLAPDTAPLEECIGSTFVVSDTGPVQRYPGSLIVARPGSSIYEESFPAQCFSVPIEKLFNFLVEHGTSDPTRSNGWRLEVSNAGLAQDETADTFRPKEICGEEIFQLSPDGPLVRAILGNFMDGLTRASKALCREMEKPRAINMKRYKEYAQKLQEYFFAELSDTESLTVQLLCLSLGHTGKEHYDILNDTRASFDGTAAKVMFFVDSLGRLWSLKILCSYRKRLGDFYSVAMTKVQRVLVNVRTMLSEVNASYLRLIHHHRGTSLSDNVPTWDNIEPLFLDDDSPWRTEEIAPGIYQETIQVLTGVGRGLWLSTALSSIFSKSADLNERGMVQLFMVVGFQNTFNRFWEVMKRVVCSDYVIFEYYKVAHELFYVDGKDKGQEMFGGADPRFGPIGFDFKEVFGTYDNPKKGVVDGIVDCILNLCDSLNLLYDSKDSVSRDEVLDLVEAAAEVIRDIGRCELGSFRLMIVLQCCAYMKVRLKSGVQLRQMFFPVKDSGSWNHVREAGVEAVDVEAVCYEIQREISTPSRFVWMDEVEVILCESKDGRLLQKFDTFVMGQLLWRIDDFGSVWIKLHNEKLWKRYTARHKRD